MRQEILRLYLDDSGSRKPDHKPTHSARPDYFALGGLLIREAVVDSARQQINDFCDEWPELYGDPLHSTDIRNRKGRFGWLAQCGIERRQEFMTKLVELIGSLPIVCIACVIDRPGYNERYRDLYGKNRWSLCKTAFAIVVERAAKHARDSGSRLRVYVEQCDRSIDRRMARYYDELRTQGHPFSQAAARYEVLQAADYSKLLYEFRVKSKSSRLMQIADLVLWPVCVGRYFPDERGYQYLVANRKLIDVHYPGSEAERGIKYSCFPGS